MKIDVADLHGIRPWLGVIQRQLVLPSALKSIPLVENEAVVQNAEVVRTVYQHAADHVRSVDDEVLILA